MQIQAERTTLKVLLGVPEHQLRIPPYQRPYAWNEEHVDELWDDLTLALGGTHFMGSLVLTGEDAKTLDVIDGQQRLTTLIILLGLIRDRWSTVKAENVGRVQRFLTEAYVEGERKYRLRSGEANWQVFRRYVLAELQSHDRRAWTAFEKLEDAQTRARNGALVGNARRLSAKLDLWLKDASDAELLGRLDKLERTVLDGLEFVRIHVTKVADAFVIFETLNDRGLALSAGDLLKNHLLQRAAQENEVEVGEMAERWDELISSLEGADITRFLRHYLLARHSQVRKDDVFDLFKSDVKTRGAGELLDELATMARWYGQFIAPSKAEAIETRRVLEDLETLRAVMCYTALLAARRFNMPESDFVSFARLAETLTFRFSTICGKDSKELERAYHLAGKKLWDSHGKDIAGARRLLIDQMPGSDEFLSAFRTQVMGQKYVVDYVLRKIENSLDTEEKATLGTRQVHVEHIMPRTLSDEWRITLGAQAPDHAMFVDRWGNLTLLGGKKNIKASNAVFTKKLGIYKDSAIQLTRRLTTLEQWNFDAIVARQQELAEQADRVWAIPSE